MHNTQVGSCSLNSLQMSQGKISFIHLDHIGQNVVYINRMLPQDICRKFGLQHRVMSKFAIKIPWDQVGLCMGVHCPCLGAPYPTVRPIPLYHGTGGTVHGSPPSLLRAPISHWPSYPTVQWGRWNCPWESTVLASYPGYKGTTVPA